MTTRLAVSGQIRVDEPCDQNARTEGRELPAPEVVAELPKSIALEVPVRIDWSDVSAELSRSLGQARAADGTRIVSVRARGSALGEAPAVAIAATLEGPACGDVWLLGKPYYDPKTSRVRLREVELAPGQPRRTEALAGARLASLVEQHAMVALPVDVNAAPPALQALVERLTEEKPEGVSVEVKLEAPRIGRVLADAGALVPVVSLTGRAGVRVE